MLTVIKLPEILNILIPLCGAKQNTLTYCFTGSAMHVAISIIIFMYMLDKCTKNIPHSYIHCCWYAMNYYSRTYNELVCLQLYKQI